LASQIIIPEHFQPEEGFTGEILFSSTWQQYQYLHSRLLRFSSPLLCSLGTCCAHAREGLDAAERAGGSKKPGAQSSIRITKCIIWAATAGPSGAFARQQLTATLQRLSEQLLGS